MLPAKRAVWAGVHGTAFQWYEAAPYFGAFMLWGFDGVETNANIPLVDLRSFLKGQGWDVPIGVEAPKPDHATTMN